MVRSAARVPRQRAGPLLGPMRASVRDRSWTGFDAGVASLVDGAYFSTYLESFERVWASACALEPDTDGVPA